MPIAKINWIIIGIYALICLGITIETATMQTDAAGRGMAWGFLIVGYIYVGVVALLNLIRVQWVRYLVLVLVCIPIVVFLNQLLNNLR